MGGLTNLKYVLALLLLLGMVIGASIVGMAAILQIILLMVA